MNTERRDRLVSVINTLHEALKKLSCIEEEEQNSYDRLPQNTKDLPRGKKILEDVSAIAGVEEELFSINKKLRSITNE